VIPFARGKSRSLSVAGITRRVNELHAAGMQEVVLTGVHIGDYRDGELVLEDLIEGVLKGSVADPEHMPMKLIARYLAPFVGKDGAKHLLTLASSVTRADLDEDEFGVIKAPTLIIWGDEDKWVEPKLADRLVNAIPEARLVRLAGVARLVPEENPEHLSELLLDFIKRRAAA
jgi:pimeloyl-ACP methyl ester carboxylesterase